MSFPGTLEGGRVFQAEGTASAKTRRCNGALCDIKLGEQHDHSLTQHMCARYCARWEGSAMAVKTPNPLNHRAYILVGEIDTEQRE